MEIEFLQDYKVKAAGGGNYTKGQRVTLSENSARHFINKGVAKIAGNKTSANASSAGKSGDTGKTSGGNDQTAQPAGTGAQSNPLGSSNVDNSGGDNMQRSKPITATSGDGLDRSQSRKGKGAGGK